MIDVETTGLSPRSDRLLEVAVVRLDRAGAVIDEWSARLNPEGPVGATHIHGITAADVASAPSFRELSHDVADRLRGAVVVAHNAQFDLAFLRAEFERSGWDIPSLPAFCTLRASEHYLPGLERRRLADCCAATGVQLDGAHSALGDARAAAGLMGSYLTMPGVPVHAELAALPASLGTVTWPSGPSRPAITMSRSTPPRTRPARVAPTRPANPPLTAQLTALSLTELTDDGAPIGTLPYLELMVEALEDGVLTENEASALSQIASAYGLGTADVAAAHRAFVTALAHLALDDGHVSRDERAELHKLAGILAVSSTTVNELVTHADQARAERLSAGLRPLPEDWALGDPLRVGDKVVFTGCDDAHRTLLEARAEQLGVRVMGNVSRQTSMLVTDGTFAGGKAAKAAELGTRVVHPDDFDVLLAHLQPATRATRAAVPADPAPAKVGATASPAAIRAWAAANGYEVSERGRLPRAVLDAFQDAQSGAN